jgi:hypothetical protein
MKANYEVQGDRSLKVHWEFPDHSKLTLVTTFGAGVVTGIELPSARVIYASEEATNDLLKKGTLPPWSVVWYLES